MFIFDRVRCNVDFFKDLFSYFCALLKWMMCVDTLIHCFLWSCVGSPCLLPLKNLTFYFLSLSSCQGGRRCEYGNCLTPAKKQIVPCKFVLLIYLIMNQIIKFQYYFFIIWHSTRKDRYRMSVSSGFTTWCCLYETMTIHLVVNNCTCSFIL